MDKAKIITIASSVEYATNGIVSKKVLENKSGGVTLFAFDQDQRLSEHTAPFDAIVQIVEGEGEIMIAGVSYTLKTGDMIIMPANIPHAVTAKKPFKMLLTMVKEQATS